MSTPAETCPELKKLCPFFLHVTLRGEVRDVGPSMLKACEGLGSAASLAAAGIEFVAPASAKVDALETVQETDAVVLRIRANGLKLKGQVLRVAGCSDECIFFLSPLVADIKEVLGVGLNFGDFATSDPIFDFLMLLQSERRAHEKARQAQEQLEKQVVQVREMNKRLETQIHERERTEQQLIAAREGAESANRAKSQFLANMSHEIRTPLNGILGLTELVLDSELNVGQRQHLSRVKTSGDHLLSLINDILDFSKIEAGELKLEAQDFTVGEVLSSIAGVFETIAEEKGLKFVVEADEVGGVRAVGDAMRLRQVLFNLVGNAVKFTERGGVTLRARNEEVGDYHELKIDVVDTGIGIPADRAEKLFQPFVQADVSHARRFGGTGLGLAISRRVMEMMGGTIQLTSVIGQGSTFSVQVALPRATSCEVPDAKVQGQARATKKPALNLEGVRILVAEDNEVNQEVVRAMLKRLGTEAVVTGNGQEAFAAFQAEAFDLVLMDCQMPVMDGFEATAAVRGLEREKGTHTPIVAMTANAMKGDQERCLLLGMDDYLSKPVSLKDLEGMVRRWTVDRKAMPEATQATGEGVQGGGIALDTDALDLLFDLAASGDRSLISKTVGAFVQDAKTQIERIDEAIAASDFATAGRVAHKFKSSCGIVGAKGCSKLCEEIETLARGQATAEGLRLLTAQLRVRAQEMIVFLETEIVRRAA